MIVSSRYTYCSKCILNALTRMISTDSISKHYYYQYYSNYYFSTSLSLSSSQDNSQAEFLKLLNRRIQAAGPLTLAQFMREALLHPKYGYYSHQEVFGTKGDFITSPEISQMFGELIAIWCCSLLERIRNFKRLRIVEFGPGKGTLMHDMLRVFHRLAKSDTFWDIPISVHLIEASERMVNVQKNKLCGSENISHASSSDPKRSIFKSTTGSSIQWHDDLSTVPVVDDNTQVTFFLGHEFLDALPIHKFVNIQKFGKKSSRSDGDNQGETIIQHNNDNGNFFPKYWREIIVGSRSVSSEEMNELELQISSRETSAQKTLFSHLFYENYVKQLNEFYDDIKNSQRKGRQDNSRESNEIEETENKCAELAQIELCPEAVTLIQEICKRLSCSNGFALFADYGYDLRKELSQNHELMNNNTDPYHDVLNPSLKRKHFKEVLAQSFEKFRCGPDTFRSFKEHKIQENPLKAPGQADLTADVDFGCLRYAVQNDFSENLAVSGPIAQSAFLRNMGMNLRLAMLLANCRDKKIREDLKTGYEMLTDFHQMGNRFKFMAITSRDILSDESGLPGFEEIKM